MTFNILLNKILHIKIKGEYVEMYMEYLLYFNSLDKTEKTKQLIIITVFLLIICIIAGLAEFLKYKYKGKTKNKTFQKFLEKI